MSSGELIFGIITVTFTAIAIGISIASYKSSRKSALDSKNAAHASTELLTQQLISSARKDTLEFSYAISDDKKTLRSKLMNAYIERELNTYEVACSNYLDGKIDKDRFMKTYSTEIRGLYENNKTTRSHIDKPGRYNALKKVYNEWFNLEK